MIRDILVDAGPLIALLDRASRDHERCVDTLKQISGKLLTTWMPVTEAMYLLGPIRGGQEGLLDMIEREAVNVLSIEHDDIAPIRRLMHKYLDLPMDFADASLVHVAARERILDIFTLDRRDFGAYRINSRQSFNIFPR